MEQAELNTIDHPGSAGTLNVAIVVGSTRPGRKADAVARWVHDIAVRRDDATFEVVDVADYALPHLDELMPPMAGQYSQPHTREWAAKINSFDAYVFVTPEYNHSTSGALKNAIDFLFAEWTDKAAGFVSYGAAGGIRAVEHLRLVMGELKIADVRSQVALSLADDWQDYTDPGTFLPSVSHDDDVAAMLDELVAWGAALKPLREPTRLPGRRRLAEELIMPHVMIRYAIKRDQVARELELLRAVYEELESTEPDGLRYATFQLEDKVSFVELAETDGPGRFSQLESFRRYRSTLDERCDEPPVVTDLHEVGSFRYR